MAHNKIKKPWIPAGRNTYKIPSTTLSKNVHLELPSTSNSTKHFSRSPNMILWTVNTNEEIASLSSASDDYPSSSSKIFLNSIKREINTLNVYFKSLKRTLLFLNRYFSTNSLQNNALSSLFNNLEEETKNIYFGDLEYLITLKENSLFENSNEAAIKMVKLKENLLSKLLECYGKATIVLQSALENQFSLEHIHVNEAENFKEKALEWEKKYASQAFTIRDLERRISILQSKISAMETYKATLETSRAELQNQLTQNESKVKALSLELTKSEAQPSISENENLLEIFEGLSKKFKLEKSTLKRALKYQKCRAEEATSTIQHLKEDIAIKETRLFEMTSNSDQLRLHLASSNNNMLEAKAFLENLKSENIKLRSQLKEQELSSKEEILRVTNIHHESITKLDDAKSENLSLKEKIEGLRIELNEFQKNEPLKKYHSEQELLSGQSQAEENMKYFILKEMKDYFAVLKKSLSKDILDCKNTVPTNEEHDYRKLQDLYNDCIKENENLQSELNDSRNRLKYAEISSLEPFLGDGEFSMQNIQMDMKLKVEENGRLKQREKDLERQLDEIKDKLQKKEIETVKLFSLEEELITTKRKLSLVEKKREEESDGYQQAIKDLKQSLVQATTDRDILEKHMQTLKFAMNNVFDYS